MTAHVDPTHDQLQAVAADERVGPVVMLNLNRYGDRDAYLRYGEVAMRAVAEVGGRSSGRRRSSRSWWAVTTTATTR